MDSQIVAQFQPLFRGIAANRIGSEALQLPPSAELFPFGRSHPGFTFAAYLCLVAVPPQGTALQPTVCVCVCVSYSLVLYRCGRVRRPAGSTAHFVSLRIACFHQHLISFTELLPAVSKTSPHACALSCPLPEPFTARFTGRVLEPY